MFYTLFCYLVAISYSIYRVQEDNKRLEHPALWFGTLFAPLTVSVAVIIVPLWYIIAYIRKRFITKG